LLSNRLVFLNSKNNSINWDLILSCETLEVYKPNLEAYKKAAKLLQLDPNQCAMVACHSFDLNAAQKAGFKTIFVKRDKEWGPDTDVSVDGDYDMVVSDFSELTALVNN
jgi:2-haloacid dehalogenase